MKDFLSVAKDGEIPAGQGRCFSVNGFMIGVFYENDQYFAINDYCPHMGASLSDGHVEDGIVLCPWHAWRFRLSDGTWMDSSKSDICTATYEVRVENGEIQVHVPPLEDTPDAGGPSSSTSSDSS
jgi:nitrite reductase (NADH) small subunit/3-phenylpropionate/trans-cinnamate dioxygenase ferredoxin subunit